jgi:hypothetical protein
VTNPCMNQVLDLWHQSFRWEMNFNFTLSNCEECIFENIFLPKFMSHFFFCVRTIYWAFCILLRFLFHTI